MAFDGSYPRQVREGGVVRQVFVRRARCRRCNKRETLPPDFVLRARLDSAASIGSELLVQAGVDLDEAAGALCAGVPARTRRSWRQRFAERADLLAAHLSACCVHFGAVAPRLGAPQATGRALEAIEGAWRAAVRRWRVPPVFLLANLVLGGELLTSRVDLPHPDMLPRPEGPRAP